MDSRWIKSRLKGLKASQLALGEAMGLPPARVTEMLNGSRKVSIAEAIEMARFLRTSLQEMLYRLGYDAPPGAEVPLVSWVAAGQLASADAVLDAEDCERIPVPDLDPKGDWIALQVQGDSMDRISPPDSIIVVDRKDRKLVPNACYVIGDGEGGATYKRFRSGPMRFEPVSTNPAHEPIFPDNTPKIIGRVRLSLLKM